ncbi:MULTISPECIES: hypothetical protein [Neisseria]|uniref:DUF4375 domain-containing protein n=1 Tax=Neisseria dumasiana TaxID=1931275 RepID=A0ABX3WR68_9NEIS|nr:hypothetical protein [Neisseria dumasiana]OSI36650.1 hypothetical protein BV913_01200 [Neisseria dumasiana]UOO85253.1 hypothetical protein LVJ88_04535 [Neisseria dumasiana]
MNNTEHELAKLVLKNLDMVEKSYDFLRKIDDDFLEKIDKKFQEWNEKTKSNNNWPRNLGKKKEEEAIWFDWDMKTGSKKIDTYMKDPSWLSLFTDLVRYDDGEVIQTGIKFGFKAGFFNLDNAGAKKFMQEQFEKYINLHQAGFQYIAYAKDEREIFLPVKLDLEKLIEEYPDYEDALQPFEDALNIVDEHMSIFESIAKDLIEKYFKKEYQQEE